MRNTGLLRRWFRAAATGGLAGVVLAACARAPSESGPRTVQPGAPGDPVRVVGPDEPASRPLHHTEADVRFMRNMIAHHEQALEMSALVPERTEREGMRRLARRIEVSQASEIALMERWLAQRGEAPAVDLGQDGLPSHDHMADPSATGMLTEEEMEGLGEAEGIEFERRFLELMIRHHEGALAMVDELLSTPGAAQDVDVFQVAAHVEADQASEIARMRAMRASLD